MIKPREQIKIQTLAFASQLLPAVIGVGSFMLLVRVAKPVVLGEYLIFLTAVSLFEMIKAGGLQSALVMRISGNDPENQKKIIGSAYWLGGIFSLSLSLILGGVYFSGIFHHNPGIEIFCGWYACLGIVTLPIIIADASGVAKQDLGFLFWLRFAQSANALLVACYAWIYGGNLEEFATVNLAFNAGVALIIILLGKTNPAIIKHKIKEEVQALWRLIRYAMATMATTNLLKSADTFLIASFMGPAAVAKYAVPLKLTELFDIPLRSLSTTAFPHLASRHNNKDPSGFKKTFIQYISWAYMLYIPALIFCLIFAEYIVVIMGGSSYVDTANIFRVFVLYALLLPTDRLTGISLDALQMPSKNFQKVFIMAIVNIVGDLLAIYYTHNLVWVAFASVLNALTGALLGWWLLEKTGVMAPGKIFSDTYLYCTEFIKKGIQTIKAKW